MDEDDNAKSASSTQRVRTETSGEGGEHGFQDEIGQMTDILSKLQAPLPDINTSEVRQLRKRVRELESSTGMDLGPRP